jgi:hypothetical protein
VRGNRFVRPFHDKPTDNGASFRIANDSAIWIAESEGIELQKNEVTEPGSFAGEAVQISHGVKNLRRP